MSAKVGGLPPVVPKTNGAERLAPRPPITVGSVVKGAAGSYLVKRLFAEGGMSRLFLVEDNAGRSHLLKQIFNLASFPVETQADLSIRYLREIDALRSLSRNNDPRFVKLIDHDPSTPPDFYVMELLPNAQDLDKAMVEWGRVIPVLSAKIIGRVLGALDLLARVSASPGNYAKFAHRDIKPGNIMFCSEAGSIKRVILIDLGILRLPDLKLTATGQYFGTPNYSAPETILYGASIADQRSDIFSLGAVLYYLLVGREAFDLVTSRVSPASFQEFGANANLVWQSLSSAGYIDANGNISERFDDGPRKFRLPITTDEAALSRIYEILRAAHWSTRFAAFASNPAPTIAALYANKPADVPGDLWQIVFRAMAPAPDGRFRTYPEFGSALEQFLASLPK
ncbi:MAG: hypothetical protein WC529_02990 [Candidatus Margulisiibacteriota bacterium]